VGWRAPGRLLPAVLLALAALVPASLLRPTRPLALVLAGLAAGTHGAAVAAIVGFLLGRYATLRGAVLGLNAAGAKRGSPPGPRSAGRRSAGRCALRRPLREVPLSLRHGGRTSIPYLRLKNDAIIGGGAPRRWRIRRLKNLQLIACRALGC
jgi:hypothetical protein